MMIAYSSGRSKTFPVVRTPSGSHPFHFYKKTSSTKKNSPIPLLPIFPPKAPLWKVLGTQKHGMLQQMSQAIKLLPLIFFHGDRSNKKKFRCQQKCWKKNLWSKKPLLDFFDESMNHLLSSPFPLSGLGIREGTHSHSHCHSSLGVSGQGRWWSLGSGKHQQANLRRVGIKDIHHPQSILQQRMPRSFNKKKTWPNLCNSGVSLKFPACKKVSWQVLSGWQHLWFADLFSLNAAKSDW